MFYTTGNNLYNAAALQDQMARANNAAIAKRESAQNTAGNPNIQSAVNQYLQAIEGNNPLGRMISASAPLQRFGVGTDNPYETKLRSLLDNPDSISRTGAYKFAFDQGQKAINRRAAKDRTYGSGNTLAALMAHGQGLASQQYGAEVDRLARLTGQQQSHILGQRQVDTSMYGAESNRIGTLGNLALNAAKADEYWGQPKANSNRYSMTPYNPGGLR